MIRSGKFAANTKIFVTNVNKGTGNADCSPYFVQVQMGIGIENFIRFGKVRIPVEFVRV